MTRKQSEAKLMSDNERQVSLTHYRAESSRWDQPATGQEQEGARGINFLLDRLPHPARTPMPAALRSSPLGLSHPAKTPMPERLRPTMGSRRVGVEKSAYAVRSERKGQLVELVDFLRQVRAEVQDGGTLTQAVADGTLWGWRARQALSHCMGEPVATWDAQPGRTQLERLALVVRALAECGEEPRRGGWTVGGSRP